MRRYKPIWWWAHILTVFALVLGLGAALLAPTLAYSYVDDDVLYNRVGGPDGGGYGDPDDPTPDPPKSVGGTDPEYSVTNPDDTGGVYNGAFGGYRVFGRNSGGGWMWRLQILTAGLRYYYFGF